MDLKLVEDLLALQRCGSFVRAAESRHVTHPAFGRRIRSLEAWAGVALVDRRAGARLTAAGQSLLDRAAPLLDTLLEQRAAWHAGLEADGARQAILRIGTGRTLARTLVADWLARLGPLLRDCRVEIHTAAMTEIARRFEDGEIDMLCCYEHPALSVGLGGQRFRHMTLAHDRLVPVSRADSAGRPRHRPDRAPLIGYAPTLSLGRLLADHRERSGEASSLAGRTAIVCDSADAIHELTVKGLGMAWLPWSLVAADCRRRLLVATGGRDQEVHFDVRLYRRRARQSPVVEAAWTRSAR